VAKLKAAETARSDWRHLFCCRTLLPLVFSALVLLLNAEPARGQVFQLEGGTSTMYQAHGGSVAFRAANYDGWVGLGSLDGFRLGAFVRTKVHGLNLGFGDDTIPFRMATDVFDSSHYFLGRGIGVGEVRGPTRLFGFVGATSLGVGTPFFRGAQTDKGVGLFFMDRQLTPTLSAFSRTVISDRQTAINGLEWQPRSGLRTAIAGGLGANRGYFASSLTAEREWFTLKAAYVRADHEFRRLTVQQPLSSEMDRENILVILRPKPYLTLSAGRQNFLQPLTQERTGIRGTVNQYLASVTAARFTFGGAIFDSHVVGTRSTGTSLSVGRSFYDRLQVNGNYLWNHTSQGQSLSSWLGTFRETISPRLTLLQLVNNSQGRTNISFGGEVVSNRIAISVEYQTLYLPFQTGNQFKQAIVLNLRLHPFGNVHMNVGSFVAPDGTVKYTAYAGTFLYHGALAGTPQSSAIALDRYIVRGRVVDEEGKAIRGAALRVDGDFVFSDSAGEFFVRKRKPATFRLEILPDQFLVPGKYELVSAPSSVRAAPDDLAKEVTVVLRHVRGATR